MCLYFKTTELSYQHFAALFGKNHSGCSEKCKLRYQNASLYSTASFWRSVGIIHSAALLRVSHQGHHSRVRYFQVLTIGINFPSPEKNKKKNHGLHLTVMRPHCDIMLTEVPLNSHPELSTRPTRSFQDASAFSPATSISLGPSYTSSSPGFHRVRAQSSLRSCKASTPCNQSYAKNSGIT